MRRFAWLWWRMAPIWRLILMLAMTLAIAGGLLYWRVDDLRHMAAHWTGEDDLIEQCKGVGALGLIRLTSRPPQTAPYAPMANTGLPVYGVNTFLEQEADPAVIERSLQAVEDAGFVYIRQQFPWEDIEISAKGDTWDHLWDKSAWDKYDRIVDMAEEHGLQIIARLDNPPAWSRAVGNAPGWTMAPPDDYEDYGDFVYQVVGRYRGRIRYYQLWNEPNIYPEWGDQPADAAAYVELLKVGYRRAKEADPNCVIIAAGLAQTTEETPPEYGPRNLSDLVYLEQMYQAGCKGYFDVMGAQVYGLWTGPYDRRASRDRASFSRAQLLREIMVRYGDAETPIWATEIGWNALPEDFPAFANYGRVTEDKQAIYAVEAYQRAEREWPWMGVMNYWFLRRPSDAEKDQTWYYFRMLEPDFAELPAYGAMAWKTHQPPVVYTGYHQEDHFALDYLGDWEHLADPDAVLGAYAYTDSVGLVRLRFQGTDLALVLRDPSQLDNLTLTIDGERRRLPRLVNQETLAGRAIPVARMLPDGEHTAVISVSKGPVGLDGLVVWRRSAWWTGWAVVFGAVLLMLGVVRLAWARPE